jgi:hypothetical protein
MTNDDQYPCPGTPAIADILQVVGGLAVYAIDSLLMRRTRHWNYRRISLSDGFQDGTGQVSDRAGCQMFAPLEQGQTDARQRKSTDPGK